MIYSLFSFVDFYWRESCQKYVKLQVENPSVALNMPFAVSLKRRKGSVLKSPVKQNAVSNLTSRKREYGSEMKTVVSPSDFQWLHSEQSTATVLLLKYVKCVH